MHLLIIIKLGRLSNDGWFNGDQAPVARYPRMQAFLRYELNSTTAKWAGEMNEPGRCSS